MNLKSDTGSGGIRKMPTGIQGFDELLGGGLPAGRVMMTPALRIAVDDEVSWFFGDPTEDEQLVDILKRAEEVRS